MPDPFYILLAGIIVVVGGIVGLRLHPFLALLLGALIVAILTPHALVEQFYLQKGNSAASALQLSRKSIGERISTEFGNTCAKIGILIGMAAILGKAMLDSGAAERIIRAVVRLTGLQYAPIGFMISSFFLGIPVFFDTVIFLMMPLAKVMSVKTGRNYLLLVLAIVAGAAMSNSLVPPAPGPLFLISALNINMGLMMACGILLGLMTITAGYLFATWANRKWNITLRDSLDAKLEDLKQTADQDQSHLPSLFHSLMPVLIPFITICFFTVITSFHDSNMSFTSYTLLNQCIEGVLFFGDKTIALITGACAALYVLARQKRDSKEGMSSFIQTAIQSGGSIVLITAAGGAFGGMLQQTGISAHIAEMTKEFQMALLPMAFMITAVIRTAQGSATVALITASGILAGMAHHVNLGFNPVYLCLAIGCGAKVIPWMNDGGFWIICKTSNLTEQEALQTLVPMFSIMACTGLVIVMIAAKLFPMI